MSGFVAGAVWVSGPLDRGERFVLLALADNANDSGYCFPSVKLISRKCLFTESYVIKTIKKLEDSGWITVEQLQQNYKRHAYQINLDKLEFKKPAADEQGRKRPRSKKHSSGELRSREISSPEQREPSQVNSSASSHELCAPLYRRTVSEPSEEPSGGTSGETVPPIVPVDASPTRCAQALFERLAVVAPEKTQRLASDAIRLQAAALGISAHKAMLLVERVAAAAIVRGETVNAFWFEDSKWKGMPDTITPASVGVFCGDIAPGVLDCGTAPEAADTEFGRRIWDGMSKAIKSAIGVQSFETWVRPIKQLGVLDGVLYLELPSEEFDRVPSRYDFSSYMPTGMREISVSTARGRAA